MENGKINILKKWLQDNGVTQTELGEILQIDQGLLSNYCNNHKFLGRANSLKVADYTGIDVTDIVFRKLVPSDQQGDKSTN